MLEMTRRSFVGATTAALASVALRATAALADGDSREANPAEDFLYEEVDGVVAITGYVGQAEEIVVPRSINGTLVGMVWDGAFRDKSAVFYVELPKGVVYIGDSAFEGCVSLEEVVLPERLVHIGAHAFDGCSWLEEVDLPDGVTEIGEYAFRGTSLARVVIPDGVPPVLAETFPEGCELTHADGSGVIIIEPVCRDDVTGLPVIEFGSYPQSGEESEPIEWLVLERRDDGTALLLSRSCLTGRPYHSYKYRVTWESCDLRAWLNSEFLEEAFSEAERSRFVGQHLSDLENPTHGTPGSADTEDSVFLLSLQEVEAFLGAPAGDASAGDTKQGLVAHPTQRAKEEGTYQNDAGACSWWLRSPGLAVGTAAFVLADGDVSSSGSYISSSDIAVRPALVVKLKS